MSDLDFLKNLGRISAVTVSVAFLFSACATAPSPDDKEAHAAYQEANDPLEPMNRAVFAFNRGFDKVLLRPAAITYRAVLPQPVRESNTNFLDNLESPVIFANDLLQAKPGRAGTTLARFVINTSIGFFGFFDPAEGMGYAYHDEDFAQTLGYWGVSSGPYLMLPILGPLPPRDSVGFAVDVLTDPLTYIFDDHRGVNYALYGVDAVDQRHQVLDQFDELERTSVDYYAAIRSLYRQRMNDLIRDGEPDLENLPDFDEEY